MNEHLDSDLCAETFLRFVTERAHDVVINGMTQELDVWRLRGHSTFQQK